MAKKVPKTGEALQGRWDRDKKSFEKDAKKLLKCAAKGVNKAPTSGATRGRKGATICKDFAKKVQESGRNCP